MALPGRLLMLGRMGRRHCLHLTPVGQLPSLPLGLLTPCSHPVKVPHATRVTFFPSSQKRRLPKKRDERKQIKSGYKWSENVKTRV